MERNTCIKIQDTSKRNRVKEMLTAKRMFLFGIICLLCDFSIAQWTNQEVSEDKYRAVNWEVKEGLAHNKIYCILKDKYGFLWIGTEGGLSRFDGSTFKNYFYNPKQRGTISGPKIFGLVEDSLYNIWIGTDKGLSRYDRKADTLSNFFPTLSKPTMVSFIVPFAATKDEVYCRETDSSITGYNVHSLKKRVLIRLSADDNLSPGGSYSMQYSIFDPSSNSVWMLSFSEGEQLLNISLSTGKRERYGWECGNNCYAEEMRYDHRRNSIWLNTDGGLLEFGLHDKKARHLDALKELEKQGSTGHIGIDIDLSGKIWFWTEQRGIFIYDPGNKSVHRVFEKDSVLQDRISIATSCIYFDRDGIGWIGTWLREGLWQILPFSEVVKNYNTGVASSSGLHTNDILNIIKGRSNEMWMGTDDGLLIFDIYRNTFETFHKKDLPGIEGDYLIPIFVDTIHKKAWLRSDHPAFFYEMDLQNKTCKPIIFKDSSGQTILPKINEYIPVHYKDGFIIAGNYKNRQVIFTVNSDTEIATQVLSFAAGTINYDLVNPTPVTDRFLFLRRADPLTGLTYVNIDGEWKKSKSPMDSIPWSFIVFDRTNSSYWIVALRQLFHYGNDFELIKEYTIEDGLPHDQIYGLIPDNKGNIWFNTYRSIYQLNAKTNQVSTLSERDGLQSVDLRDLGEGIAKDDNGDLYFTTGGLTKGFKKVNPERFISPPSYVYIKSLGIKEFSLPLSTSADVVQQLSLKYFQNRINIETGTIDYYSQGKNRIRYKLEIDGEKDSWQYAPANYTIRYEELPPGKYILQIQASNAANEFTSPIKEVLFHISPAFWNTWWFRTIAAAFMLGVFYIVIRYRTRQKFKLSLERSGKEKQIAELGQKTAELQQQKIEMEMQALRAQMNPHFIFNSLNSINRFILQNNRAQASEYLTKFSKLVRMILQNSQARLISLESELESLNLYLDLEAVRFEHRFAYKISYPKDLDIEVLKVPPLVIQPFTENAIWHGLMHKEDKGQLDIDVSEKDDYLYIKITDNGIGRKKAAELASKSATQHKSMGLRITKDRIAILQKTNGAESPIKIIDLEHEDGSAAGTEVIIKMPVIEEV